MTVIVNQTQDDRQQALLDDCERWLVRLHGTKVPAQLHDGLARYLGAGVHPGSFLEAVLSSQVSAAVGRADVECRAAFVDLVMWLHDYAPAVCWGSDENVSRWRASFTETCVRCRKPAKDRDFDGHCEACASAPGVA